MEQREARKLKATGVRMARKALDPRTSQNGELKACHTAHGSPLATFIPRLVSCSINKLEGNKMNSACCIESIT